MSVQIEVLSQKALDDLKKLRDEILASLEGVKTLNNEFKKTTVPSDITKAINATNEATKRSNKTVSDAVKLQKEYQKGKAQIIAQADRSVKASEKERLAELKLAKDREKAFDKFEASLKKQQRAREAQVNKESALRERLAKQRKKEEAQAEREAKIQEKLNEAYTKASRKLNELRRNAKNVGLEFGITSEQFKKAQKEVVELDKELKDLDKSLGQSQREVGNYSGALSELFPLFGRLQTSLDSIADAPNSFESGATALKSFKKALAGVVRTALAFIATPIGATIAALAGIGLVTKEFLDYNKTISKSLKLTEKLTALKGSDLNQFRADVEALSTTFEKDFGEVLKASNSLVKNFGVSFDESLVLIQDGLVRGADINGDFLEQIREYPVALRKAGLSASDFTKVLIAQGNEGVFNDKLIDSIKEATLSLNEFDKAQQEALSLAFGEEFANEIGEGLRTGSTTAIDAILDIGDEAEKLGLDFQQIQKITADVFKGAGEDAGGFENIVRILNNTLRGNEVQLTTLQKQTLLLSEANQELARAKDRAFNSSSAKAFSVQLRVIWTNLQTFFFDYISSVRQAITSLSRGISDVIKPFADLAKQIPFIGGLLEKLGGSTFSFSNAMKVTLNNVRLFSASLSGIGGVVPLVKDKIIEIVKAVVELGKVLLNPIAAAQAINNGTFLDAFSGLKDTAVTAGEDIAKAFSEAFNKSVELSVKDEELEDEQGGTSRGGVTVGDLDRQIQQQQQLLQGATSREEAKKIQEEIALLEKKKDAILGVNNASSQGASIAREAATQVGEIISQGIEDAGTADNIAEALLPTAENLRGVLEDVGNEISPEEQAEAINELKGALGGLESALGLSSGTFQNLFDQIEQGFSDSGETAQAFADLAVGALSLITEASNQRLENQLVNLEKEKELTLTFAGDSAAAKEQIELRFAEKEKAIKRKQAENNKQQALFEIASGTAVAIVKALPNIPLSIAIGAIGLAQAAVVASQKIPEFKDGVRDFSGGTALINEVRDEVVTTPDGSVYRPKGRNLLVDLPQGANVYSSEQEFQSELKDMLGENGINGYGSAIYGNPITPNVMVNSGITKEEMSTIMAETLAMQPVNTLAMDKSGFQAYTEQGHTKRINRNNRFSFKGKKL